MGWFVGENGRVLFGGVFVGFNFWGFVGWLVGGS